ncbi:MAG: putative DNA binding domain-containing protein [Clostridia bacterium]|nr:putative DNA binding domain-containing protein [Clostridia bacterium]
MLEDKNTEFKREYVEDIKKTLVAFANTDGGNLYIGIDDDGNAVEVNNIDGVMLQVSNVIRDAIKPDLAMFCDVSVETVQDKKVVKITVNRGTARPYYLAAKGIRPEGVYVRHGASSVPASESAILSMIRETAGDSNEEARSLIQELTFNEANIVFENKQIPFGEAQKRSLGLIGEDGTYTNLALLLSDQCTHTVKIAVFEGKQKTVFKDRREFCGSLLKQLNDAYQFIDQFNHTHAHTEGLYRVEKRAYPTEAIREALLNAIVHREYSFSASTLISIFDNRIEFVSIGGLARGISQSDILLGISIARNKKLADVFYRLHLIEAYGTGMPKIMEAYKEYGLEPHIEISDNAFKITLPNTNAAVKETKVELTENEQGVLSVLKEGIKSRPEIQKALGFSQTTAIVTIAALLDKGLIIKVGNGNKTKYKLV